MRLKTYLNKQEQLSEGAIWNFIKKLWKGMQDKTGTPEWRKAIDDVLMKVMSNFLDKGFVPIYEDSKVPKDLQSVLRSYGSGNVGVLGLGTMAMIFVATDVRKTYYENREQEKPFSFNIEFYKAGRPMLKEVGWEKMFKDNKYNVDSTAKTLIDKFDSIVKREWDESGSHLERDKIKFVRSGFFKQLERMGFYDAPLHNKMNSSMRNGDLVFLWSVTDTVTDWETHSEQPSGWEVIFSKGSIILAREKYIEEILKDNKWDEKKTLAYLGDKFIKIARKAIDDADREMLHQKGLQGMGEPSA